MLSDARIRSVSLQRASRAVARRSAGCAGALPRAPRSARTHLSPALTPLGFDPAHPFPFMSNLSTNWGFVIRGDDSIETRMVRVKIPSELPPSVSLKVDTPVGERRFIALEEVIYHNATKLLSGMTIVSGTLLRIIRNAEVELEDEEGESLRDVVTDAVQQRRFEPVVRVDFGPKFDAGVRSALMERFGLTDVDVFELPGLLDYPDLLQIASLDIPGLRDPSWTPQPIARLSEPERALVPERHRETR